MLPGIRSRLAAEESDCERRGTKVESEAMKALRIWHGKFGVPVLGSPQAPSEERRNLRVELIREECEEFAEASRICDVTGAADALADLLYVVYGAALEWGIPLDDVFAEVHRSNLSKVWPDGTVHCRQDGKVLKPPTYSPADVAKVLKISAAEDLHASSADE